MPEIKFCQYKGSRKFPRFQLIESSFSYCIPRLLFPFPLKQILMTAQLIVLLNFRMFAIDSLCKLSHLLCQPFPCESVPDRQQSKPVHLDQSKREAHFVSLFIATKIKCYTRTLGIFLQVSIISVIRSVKPGAKQSGSIAMKT